MAIFELCIKMKPKGFGAIKRRRNNHLFSLGYQILKKEKVNLYSPCIGLRNDVIKNDIDHGTSGKREGVWEQRGGHLNRGSPQDTCQRLHHSTQLTIPLERDTIRWKFKGSGEENLTKNYELLRIQLRGEVDLQQGLRGSFADLCRLQDF
jgi:hypothetical protein